MPKENNCLLGEVYFYIKNKVKSFEDNLGEQKHREIFNRFTLKDTIQGRVQGMVDLLVWLI